MLFVGLFLVLGVVEPNYDPVRDHVSELAFTRDGWVQTFNFFVSGCLLLAFAASLAARGRRRSVAMAVSVGLVGLGLVVAGAFPVGLEHAGGALLALLGLIASCLVLGVVQARAKRVARATLAFLAALVVIVFFQLSGADYFSGYYVADVAGLTQRVWLLTGFGAIEAYAIATLRRKPDEPEAPRGN